MAHLLRITDNNGTVNLNAGNQNLLSYVPKSPNLSLVNYTPESLRDGGETLSVTRRNVTESAQVLFGGTAVTDIQAAVGSVEAYLKQAEHYQMYRAGSPVYMEFQPNGAGTVYRSEILSGKVEVDDLTLSAGQWNRSRVKGLIAYTRRFYWEDATERAIQLYNGGGTASNGVTVYGHDDAGHDNYVEIAGSSVAGDYPAAMRLEMQETTGGETGSMNVYVGHNAFSNPAAMNHIYEAEAASGAGTKFPDTECSNGSVFKSTWATSENASRYQWTLPAADMNIYGGQYFGVFARWGTVPVGNVKLQLRLSNVYGQALYTGPQVQASGSVLEKLGVISLPPGQYAGTSSHASGVLNLWGQGTAGGTMTLDYLMLMPLDSYKYYNTPDSDSQLLATHDYLVDDALTESLYLEDRSNQYIKIGGWFSQGRSPTLWPGKTQRLYFLWDKAVGAHDITQTLKVVASYRPRKLTL